MIVNWHGEDTVGSSSDTNRSHALNSCANGLWAAARRPQPHFCLGQLAPAESEADQLVSNLPLGWLLKGEVLGSRLTNNPSGQRQPLTPREQAGLDRRGVGVGGLQPC
ncbi:hypothetical protein V6N12_067719 [Hibiscus sabdariffa]|uniref:Uncharacterized protein n=1 Tax=Hibiscus sabdariffa TaxID=183260 RepID=A0ABR2A1H4_9ROSI